jgi:hypothetical protein
MSNPKFFKLMAVLIGLLLVWLFNSSCRSEKYLMKQVDKSFAFHPNPTIRKLRAFAPCVTSASSIKIDSSAYISSLDSLIQSKAFYEALIRGIESMPHDTAEDIKCPTLLAELAAAKKEIDYQEQYIINLTDDFNHIKPIIINRTDTVEDLSKVIEKDNELTDAKTELTTSKKETTEVKADRDKLKDGRNSWRKWFLILAGINIGGIVIFIATKGSKLSLKSLIHKT